MLLHFGGLFFYKSNVIALWWFSIRVHIRVMLLHFGGLFFYLLLHFGVLFFYKSNVIALWWFVLL